MLKEIVIPKERVAVLIGRKGEVKKKLSELANVDISIRENAVTINGDPLNVLKAEKVIYAIGRGFSPEKAFALLDDDYYIDTIELPRGRNNLERIRARVIGTKGYIKKYIEDATDTNISVYGKTVCIIGRDTDDAAEAVKMIVKGSKFNTIFKFLARRKREKVI